MQLIGCMARATGADLGQAYADGRLNQEEWAALIERCRGCGWAEGCAKWLAAPGSVDAINATPDRCVNRETLRAFAQGTARAK